jgi:hypothetical protein
VSDLASLTPLPTDRPGDLGRLDGNPGHDLALSVANGQPGYR